MPSHQLMLFILGAFVSTCVAQEATCAAGDSECIIDGDHSQLLQVDVVKHEGEDHHDLHDVKGTAHAQEDSEGWPSDIFKKIKSVLGAGEQLEKDFDAITKAVVTFKAEVHTEIAALIKETTPKLNIYAIKLKVEATYLKVYASVEKVVKALEKVSTTFLNGIGKVSPAGFKSALETALKSVTDQAKFFAISFKTAELELRKVNTTMICLKVKDGLHEVLNKATGFASSATHLSTKGLSKEILETKKLLPAALKKEIDRMLAKANSAADHLLSSLSPTMKEIAHGVSEAFKGHCDGLPHAGAGRAEVGLLSVLVLAVFSFFM